MKRDRTLVRGSKHSVRLLYAVTKFAILLDRNGPIYLNEVSTESAYIIYYEYPIFSLAQIRRLSQSASLVCDSNPVVASQTRFAVHRMERRICANLNLTYSQSMEHGLSPDMFFKYIGGVFPAEIRPCFPVLSVRSSHVYATGVSCPFLRSDEFVPC